MKILYANLMFQLPDDFVGTYRDALRVYADYDEGLAKANDGKSPNFAREDGVNLTEDEEETLTKAMHIIQRVFEVEQKCGRRAVNSFAFAEWSEGDTDWITYDYDGETEIGAA